MILQCDQCNTKFRLDDSKLKPGGVKVRCSKCRHVFIAGTEQKQEESDFDAILSGLGAPTPGKPEDQVPREGLTKAPEPAAQAAEPPAPEQPAAAAPAPEPDFAAEFAGFEFAPEAAAPAEPTVKEEAEATPPSQGLDFGEFAFMEEPAAPQAEPAAAAGPGPGEELEPAEGAGEKEAAAPSGSALEFGEFDFNPEPTVKPEAAAAAPELDFGEFSFPEEPAAPAEEAAPAAPELDFGEFSFPEEPPAPAEEAAPAAPELDFGEFSFTEEPPALAEEAAPAAKGEFDFSDFSFTEEPAAAEEAPAAKEEFDFSDFSFSDEPPAMKETTAAEEGSDLSEFPFGEEISQKPEEEGGEPGGFSLGEFSFAEEKETPAVEPAKPPAGEGMAEGHAAGGLAAAGLAAAGLAAAGAAKSVAPEPAEAPVPPVQPEPQAKKEAGSSLDFSFGGKPEPIAAPFGGEEEEELPPLSISSRRKGRSILTVSVVAICVAVILALTGAGLYLLQSGPTALAKFDKLGLGFVGKWFGMETPEEGRITIRKPLASFYQNKEAGELFVITGEAVNNFKKARASIHVRVTIFDKKGAVLVQKTAYCGNRLSKEQLETLPMPKIDAIMNNQFGDSLSNLSVKPGQAIGFVVAVANVPKDAADFGVEPVGSTVASQ